MRDTPLHHHILLTGRFGKNLSDYTYEKDGAVWLKTSEYGDEKDRVILRSDGRPTYFHNDIVYHAIKWHLARNPERANIQLINIFGADHHGYINRLNAVMRMWGIDDVSVILTQMVSLEATDASGETVSFIGSKREGQYLRLKEDFIDRVGVDAARWYFLSETPSAHLIINVDKATEQNMSNPVFYVQYAYARFTQILSKSETLGVSVDGVFVLILKR
jgi:arginyl-tRNA synthetase